MDEIIFIDEVQKMPKITIQEPPATPQVFLGSTATPGRVVRGTAGDLWLKNVEGHGYCCINVPSSIYTGDLPCTEEYEVVEIVLRRVR